MYLCCKKKITMWRANDWENYNPYPGNMIDLHCFSLEFGVEVEGQPCGIYDDGVSLLHDVKQNPAGNGKIVIDGPPRYGCMK